MICRLIMCFLLFFLTPLSYSQEWSTISEPLNRNLILRCDLYRTDYEYRFTNLFFFRRSNQLVSSVKLAPDGTYEAKVPIFHHSDANLYGFTGFIDRLEIYDYYSGFTWFEGVEENTRYYAGSRISRYDGSYSNIYDYYVFGYCVEIEMESARGLIAEYNNGLEEQRVQASSMRLF